LASRTKRASEASSADAVWPWRRSDGRQLRWFELLEADAVEALLLHAWPDNLRGLRRTLAGLANDPTRPLPLAALPADVLATVAALSAGPQVARPAARGAGPGRRKRPPRDVLLDLVRQCQGNLEQVGRELACDRRQVYRWLRATGIDMEEVARHRPAHGE
jgi:transcriptional regulator of acetoin/glycerol metabolism